MVVKYKEEEEEEEEQVGQFAICTSPIIHPVCPPSPHILHNHCLQSLGTAVILRRNCAVGGRGGGASG